MALRKIPGLRPGIFLGAMDPWILGVGYLSISRSHPQASFTTQPKDPWPLLVSTDAMARAVGGAGKGPRAREST